MHIRVISILSKEVTWVGLRVDICVCFNSCLILDGPTKQIFSANWRVIFISWVDLSRLVGQVEWFPSRISIQSDAREMSLGREMAVPPREGTVHTPRKPHRIHPRVKCESLSLRSPWLKVSNAMVTFMKTKYRWWFLIYFNSEFCGLLGNILGISWL